MRTYQLKPESFQPAWHFDPATFGQLKVLRFFGSDITVLCTPRHLTENDIRAGNKPGDAPFIDKYLEIRRRYSLAVSTENSIFEPPNYGGVNIQMFAPTQSARGNLNNHSLVLIISYAGSKIIIPGDNESPSWNELLALPTFINAIQDADILLAAHHGRDKGYAENLFKYISPKLTIVSDVAGSETSVTGTYSAKSTGWDVYSRATKLATNRKCLTTMSDQTIVVRFGNNLPWQIPPRYINVTIA